VSHGDTCWLRQVARRGRARSHGGAARRERRVRQRAWPGCGAIPSTMRAVTRRTPGEQPGKASSPGLTATVTETAATSGKHQRPATAHNSRTICANWGYARPEKHTVGDQRRSAAIVARTVAKPLNSTRRTWTTLEYRPSLRPLTDGPGRLAHSYGSEGCSLGCSSPQCNTIQARPAERVDPA
jgi:hypothetical protein